MSFYHIESFDAPPPPAIALTYHVGMIQFAQETNFSNHVAGYSSFWRTIGKGNAFDCDSFAAVHFLALVDDSVGALTNHVGAVSEG